MKRTEMCKVLKSLGFRVVRFGRHEVWGNGTRHIALPRGKEINRIVARRLLKELNVEVANV